MKNKDEMEVQASSGLFIGSEPLGNDPERRMKDKKDDDSVDGGDKGDDDSSDDSDKADDDDSSDGQDADGTDGVDGDTHDADGKD